MLNKFKHSIGQVLNYLSNCDFSYPLHENNFEEHILEPLQLYTDFNFDYELGASKLCIIPRDLDFVIKIPFSGNFYKEQFSPFGHTTIDKDGNENQQWDYCQVDCEVYAAACSEGLNTYLAAITCIGEINSYPIYIQEKAVMWNSEVNRLTEDEERITFQRHSKFQSPCFCPSWLFHFYNQYGEQEYVKLIDFIETYPIVDLYCSNIGKIGNRFVLVDYSGYYG